MADIYAAAMQDMADARKKIETNPKILEVYQGGSPGYATISSGVKVYDLTDFKGRAIKIYVGGPLVEVYDVESRETFRYNEASK